MVQAALEGQERFEVEVRGLNVARDSVFVELYPAGLDSNPFGAGFGQGNPGSMARRPAGFDDASPTPTWSGSPDPCSRA